MDYDPKEIAAFIRRNQVHMDFICDYLSRSKLKAIEGQQILLLIAGISAGIAQQPIVNNNWSKIIAIGWSMGAENADEV